MQIVFGDGPGTVLGDDMAELGPNRYTVQLEQWGARGDVQDEALAPTTPGAGPFLADLSNERGPFVFVATCSDYASLDLAVLDFYSRKSLRGTQANLYVKAQAPGGVAVTEKYANAVLESVERDRSSNGVRFAVRYTFRTSGRPSLV